MSIILTTPEFTHNELSTTRNALAAAHAKLRSGGWAHQSLINETDDALSTVIAAATNAEYTLEITVRTKQIIIASVIHYGGKHEHARSTVLDIIKKLENAEVK